MTSIAIMQPYFFPYPGYFRLCAASDIFVFLDDVQFPRRGWVHRNRLKDAQGRLQWLTLPLEKGDRDLTRIVDLRFRRDAGAAIAEQERRFPLFSTPASCVSELAQRVGVVTGNVADGLVEQVKRTSALIGFDPVWVRSSELDLDPALRGWRRLAAIAEMLGADTCVNATGGAELYDATDFASMGIQLRILAPHQGAMYSILQSMHDIGVGGVRAEVLNNMRYLFE